MKKRITLPFFWLPLLLLIIPAAGSVYAQNRVVTGTVKSETGEGMPGVNVVIKNTVTGTTTDASGRFSLPVPGDETILVFTFVGYSTTELTVGTQTTLNVDLKPDLAALQEVVVIGYGSQRRADVTTAVAHVSPETFVPGAVRNAGELLRGKVAGLAISTPSGDPAAGSEILLRGITSIYGSSAPLVLIDGYTGDLNAISPNDIESVDVLKDASAAAIYGTRGKNGVILITTKKAKGEMTPVVEYSGYVATDRMQRKADFMDAADVRQRVSEGLIDPSYDLGNDTDWLKQITRTPVTHYHNISLRGGTSRTRYVAVANYKMAQGIFQKSDNEEFKVRMDLDHYLIADKLKVNVNVLKGMQSYGGFDGFSYRQALIRNPTDRITDDAGKWVEHTGQFQYENPVARVREENVDNSNEWTWLTGGVSFYPVDGLELKVVGSQHTRAIDVGSYQTRNHISTVRDGKNGVAYIAHDKTVENFLDLTADYSKAFGNHRISALLGYSYVDSTYSGSSITNFDFPTDLFSYHSIETGRALREGREGASVNSYKNDWTLVGFFGRIGYGFKDRYNVLASLRYEGSSRFGDNNKWGMFPAISAGWTISNEDFMSSVGMVSNLKLRAGFGQTGSISVAPYSSLMRYGYQPSRFYFDGERWRSILTAVSNYNPNLGWETNTEYNIGIDFGIMNGRVTGAVDYYDRRLDDLVYLYPVPVPPNQFSTTLANAASLTNKGIEVSVNIEVLKKGKFEWNTNVNYSANRNRLTSISNDEFKIENDFFYAGYTGDPVQMSTHKLEKGKAIGSFFGYKSVGLTEDAVWLIENEAGERKSIRDAKDDDRQILGNGLPKSYLAWNNTFRYGNFDLSVTMRGAFGYQVLNYQRMYYENPTIAYNRLRSAYDLIDGKVLNYGQAYVSHYIEDADFWKIDNVTLGYRVPANTIPAVKAAHLYVAASNLAIITGYKGIDPEVTRKGMAPGNDDRDKYPTVRTFTLGMNLTF